MSQRVVLYCRPIRSDTALPQRLQEAVKNGGDTVVATYEDDREIVGRGKYAAWRRLISSLDDVHQIVISNAGDIPGRTVRDLLNILSLLRDHGVPLHLLDLDSGITTLETLDIIRAYRRAKLSEAIRVGQMKAVANGKHVGRPKIPGRIVTEIEGALAQGGGIRSIARRFKVSPASVVNVSRMSGG